MHLETDLLKIKQFAAKRENENFRFRVFLKGKDGDKIDEIVHQLHKEITPQIDCTLCGNCCNCMKPEVYEEDINRLSLLKNISSEKYLADYCEKNDGDIYLKNIPCRYLDGKKCSIYESRPTQCRKFPYTDEDEFISRLYGMISYYEICPIVFNLMERLKEIMRFRR